MKISQNLEVNFSHDVAHKFSSCTIVNKDKEVTGLSRCSDSDLYNKTIGRRVSLTRAIAKSNLNKVERTAIWRFLADKGVKMYNHKK